MSALAHPHPSMSLYLPAAALLLLAHRTPVPPPGPWRVLRPGQRGRVNQEEQPWPNWPGGGTSRGTLLSLAAGLCTPHTEMAPHCTPAVVVSSAGTEDVILQHRRVSLSSLSRRPLKSKICWRGFGKKGGSFRELGGTATVAESPALPERSTFFRNKN